MALVIPAATQYFDRPMWRFFVTFFCLLFSTGLDARERVWVVGSSTVYPFVTSAAEHFGRRTGSKTPIVEATGTGGGIKLFCSKAGTDTPDMVNASRAIKDSELALCKKNGIMQVIPLKIGLDGIVLANAAEAQHYRLTRRELFLALAKEVPQNGKLVPNFYQRWNEINPALPANAIEIYGPPPTSGTRDAFVELVMHTGCEAFPEFKAAFPDKKDREKQCGVMREDGRFMESGENDNLVIQKLVSNPLALGIFGFSFLEENADKVQGSHIEGFEPTLENVSSGKYPVTRPLYVYAKGEHLQSVRTLLPFMQELTRESTIGEEGFLAEKGLIPLPVAEREALRAKVPTIKQP